jgi:hypothetical protein
MATEQELRKSVLLAEVEATYGIDPSPGATNVILCSIPDVSLTSDMKDRDYIRDSYSQISKGIGIKRQTISFKCEGKGANNADVKTEPYFGVLLKACGLTKSTTTSPDSCKYTPSAEPNASSGQSATIYFYMDTILYALVGSKGNAVLNFEVGSYPQIDFNFTGFYATPITASKPGTITWPEHQPPLCTSLGLTIGSYSPVGVSRVSLDLGNSVMEKQDMQDSDGLSSIRIAKREPKLTIECDVDALSAFDPYSIFEDATTSIIAWSVGSAQNIIGARASAAQLIEPPKTSEKDGRAVYTLNFGLTGSDDEYYIQTK